MSEQTPSSKLPQDVTGDQDDNLTRLAAGGAPEKAPSLSTGHRHSIQGLIAIIKDKSYCSLAAPPRAEPIEEDSNKAASKHPEQEQEKEP